jgi:hypothetical protein
MKARSRSLETADSDSQAIDALNLEGLVLISEQISQE